MTKSVPRTLAIAAAGGLAQFNEALAVGDMVETTDESGAKFYGWREMRAGTKQGCKEAQILKANKAISQEAYAEVSKMLDSLEWNFHVSAKQLKIANATETLPEEAKEKITEALVALRKASQEAKMLLSKLGELRPLSSTGEGHVRTLQEHLKAIFAIIGRLNHIETFGKTLEDVHVDVPLAKKELAAGAKHLVDLFEHVEVAKAYLKMSK